MHRKNEQEREELASDAAAFNIDFDKDNADV